MKITVLAAALAAGTLGMATSAVASADPDVTTLGSQGRLQNGNIAEGWTISNLRPSSDAIAYPVQGTLWEATATDQALAGGAPRSCRI